MKRNLHVFFVFYKHMKFRIQAWLCLAIYDFEARIMLSLCLTFQGTSYRYEKNLTPLWLRSMNIFLVISIDL